MGFGVILSYSLLRDMGRHYSHPIEWVWWAIHLWSWHGLWWTLAHVAPTLYSDMPPVRVPDESACWKEPLSWWECIVSICISCISIEAGKIPGIYIMFNHVQPSIVWMLSFSVAPDCWIIIASFFSLESMLEWTMHIFEKDKVDGNKRKLMWDVTGLSCKNKIIRLTKQRFPFPCNHCEKLFQLYFN